MVDPDHARRALQLHFQNASTKQFHDNLEELAPELVSESELPVTSGASPDRSSSELHLVPTLPAPLSLDAYLACALSNLTEDQRNYMFQLSDVISTICEQYQIRLYEPRKKTDPVHNSQLPSEEVERIDHDRVLGTDLVIHLTHYPSTGSGKELAWAESALIPTILIKHSSSKVSRMVLGTPGLHVLIEYIEPEELRAELHRSLGTIRPLLEVRKLAFANYDVNLVGNRIRSNREALGLTREEVAERSQLITVEQLRRFEESKDRVSDPGLNTLRQLAAILNTTVADLVEPDLESRMTAALMEWANRSFDESTAARYRGITIRDRNKLLRRFLLRLIDSLEREEN
jgi:transcriptional regulator with XRE-family HTH domain